MFITDVKRQALVYIYKPQARHVIALHPVHCPLQSTTEHSRRQSFIIYLHMQHRCLGNRADRCTWRQRYSCLATAHHIVQNHDKNRSCKHNDDTLNTHTHTHTHTCARESSRYGLLFGSKLGFSRILDSLYGACSLVWLWLHRQWTDLDEIWSTLSTLWGLALADFRRDPYSSVATTWKARRNFIYFCQVSNARFHQFPVKVTREAAVVADTGRMFTKFAHKTSIGVAITSCDFRRR